jgi:Ca2+-binding EF-hand superfamily protein
MPGKLSLLPRILAAILMLALAGAAADAQDTTKTNKEPPDPPGTTLYMTQLRALFDAWDLNGDGYLDKEELAKAFRGPNAKPYDYDPKAGKSTDPKTTTDPKDPPKDPDPKDPPKDTTTKDTTKTDPKKPDYTMYPDYNFLVALDTDGDGMISRKEFMAWARDFAVQLKLQSDQTQKLLQVQQKLLAAQQKLANTTAKVGSAEYKKLVEEVKKEETAAQKEDAALKKIESQMKAAQKHIATALKNQKK